MQKQVTTRLPEPNAAHKFAEKDTCRAFCSQTATSQPMGPNVTLHQLKQRFDYKSAYLITAYETMKGLTIRFLLLYMERRIYVKPGKVTQSLKCDSAVVCVTVCVRACVRACMRVCLIYWLLVRDCLCGVCVTVCVVCV